jgi:D-3-phosphoglycerate dehydrogenase / 2-oxoglutarate reductase
MKVAAVYFLGDTDRARICLFPMAEFLSVPCKTEQDIIEASRDADVIVTAATLQPFSGDLIERLGAKVRHIASAGVGYDSINIVAATKRNIVVTSTPYYCLEEVSDHAMALILALARKLFITNVLSRKLRWRGSDAEIPQKILPPMKKLRGQTLGLIGFGNIAKALVPKAKGFGLNVIACDPNVPEDIMRARFGVEKVELNRLLTHSDFVSLHVALSEKTRHMIREEHFRMMKPTAYFINTARGGLVDERALARALELRWIAGAGLDVMELEPPVEDNPILKMENVILSGHTAQFSDESEKALWQIPIEEAVLTVQGKFPRFAVNSDIMDRWLKQWANKSATP